MEPTGDKEWATKYLLDPMNEPEPSEETGPGSHFSNTVAQAPAVPKEPAVSSTLKSPVSSTYPTPPTSASPTQSNFHPTNPYSPHRREAFAESSDKGKGRRRGSSLGERFPGDISHRPLAQLRKEAKAADRSPHLKKTHIPGADTIDTLDISVFGGFYHHEGPYDATLLSRNLNPKDSPVEAVKSTNAEALRATPRENVIDSLEKHVPLQGIAVIPPGMPGVDGRLMQYEEGADLMRESDAPGGAYKRWPDVKYLPEDLKGKGEPSYSIEKGLKDHKHEHRRNVSDDNSYEMQPQTRPDANRQRSASGTNEHLTGARQSTGNSLTYSQHENAMRRSNTTGGRLGEGLKKRFGSLRRSKKVADVM